MKFVVARYAPAPDTHSECFAEMLDTVGYGLRDLGHEVYGFDWPPPPVVEVATSAQMIILGDHRRPDNVPPPPGAIIYNLEQTLPEHTLALFRKHTVWDYSPRHVAKLRAMGVNAIHVPVGHVKQLEGRIKRLPPEQEDIDVLFYGSMNERRAAILDQLRRKGVRVQTLFGCYGAERDAIISRSKIILNVHFYEDAVLETVRLSYLVENGRFTISERSPEPDVDYLYAQSGVRIVDYKALVVACLEAICAGDLRRYKEAVCKRPFLRNALPESGVLRRALAESLPEQFPDHPRP